MVYESDFYTTRRPYRPSYSTYTTSYSTPSRQVRVLPGLGKVHIVHTYDRIVPYVGHKRLTVVSPPPKVYSTRPSVLQKEYDWIENRIRPWVGYSAVNRYLNSDSAVRMIYLRDPIKRTIEYRMYPEASYLRHKIYKPLSLYCDYYEPIRSLFWNSSFWPSYNSVSSFADQLPADRALRLQRIFDDETRLIRAQTASLLRKIHDPVPRVQRLSWPLSTTTRYYENVLPARFSNDHYIQRTLMTSPKNAKVQYTSYYTEPVRKYIGQGRLACVSYAGDRGYSRRGHVHIYEDPVKSDIQLLSYYINKFKKEKELAPNTVESSKVALSPARPSRKFSAKKEDKEDEETKKEMEKLRAARAARLAYINEEEKTERIASKNVDDAVSAKKKKEETRLAEEKALAEEAAKKEAQAIKDEATRKAELARQEALAAQAAAERAAELERQAELARQQELEIQAEIERKRKEEEERALKEEQRRLEEEARVEEEKKQLLRLEELARQAEEEQEAELARQAEELAELARQEAELAEEAKKQAEEEELARQKAELEELARQEAELAELEKQEQELARQAQEERENAQKAQQEAEEARLQAEEAELAALEPQQAELNALDTEAQALEAPEEQETQEEEEEEMSPEETELAVLERQQAELDAFEAEAKEFEEEQREEKLEELERAQAELDALEAEAKALESGFDDEEEPEAIAEDIPGAQSDPEEAEDAEE